MSCPEKEEKKYEWVIFAQSYLLLARIACQELLDSRDNKHSKSVKVDNFDILYQITDLFIPIVFNIKHGLEVFIKTISVLLTGKYKEGHDIKELSNNLKIILPEDKKIYSDKLENIVLKYFYCDIINNKKIVNIHDELNDVFRYPDNKSKVKINLDEVNKDMIRQLKDDIDEIYDTFNNLGYDIDK